MTSLVGSKGLIELTLWCFPCTWTFCVPSDSGKICYILDGYDRPSEIVSLAYAFYPCRFFWKTCSYVKIVDDWFNTRYLIDILMVYHGLGSSAISDWVWSKTFVLDGTEYNYFSYCHSSGLFNWIVSLFRLVVLSLNGIRHSMVTSHHQPFNTAVSGTTIFVVRTSYMFTSFPS